MAVIHTMSWYRQPYEWCKIYSISATETWSRCVKIVEFIIIYIFVMSCNLKIMYVLSWTVYAFTSVLFLCLFPELQSNSRNKHQNNPLEREQTVRHSSPFTILYMITYCLIYFQGSRCDLYPPCYCCLMWDVMIYRSITITQNVQYFIVSLFNSSLHNHTMIILHIIITTDVHGKWNNLINSLLVSYHWSK